MRCTRITALFLLFTIASSYASLDSISLQLKWKHQFQFAGYYAAKELGLYKKAGLYVNLLEADTNISSISQVINGKAEYGVGGPDLLLERAKGNPLTVLAVIFQHSPSIIISRQDSSIRTLGDLVGKKVMMEPSSGEILAYLLHEKLNITQFKTQPHVFSYQALVDGKVDAMSAYITDEVYPLKKLGFPMLMLNPRSVGVDFYGDNLFTTEDEIRNHPERVKAFREASLQGWEYAMDHPGEIIHLILSKYSTRHDSLHLAYEAASMQSLVGRPIIPIGFMHLGRWQYIAESYAETGLLPGKVSMDGFIYEEPPQTVSKVITQIPRHMMAIGIIGALLFLLVFCNNFRLRIQIKARTKLQKELERAKNESEKSKEELVNILRELELWATTDKLTELANRRHLEQRGETEVARCVRYHAPLSLLLIDLDHFKQINDREGHHMGDQVLIEVAKVIRNSVRATDLPGRWGGEEFLVIIPNTTSDHAVTLAEKLRRNIAERRFPCEFTVTASIGIVGHQGSETLEEMLKRVDVALYKAKQTGRNRIELAV